MKYPPEKGRTRQLKSVFDERSNEDTGEQVVREGAANVYIVTSDGSGSPTFDSSRDIVYYRHSCPSAIFLSEPAATEPEFEASSNHQRWERFLEPSRSQNAMVV